MRQNSTVVFCAVDSLLPIRGRIQDGFDQFCVALEHANVPMVWVSSRSRHQMDEPIRKLGHRHPFIAEDGCGAYLPEGYFHLRAEGTMRMGRFTCIPVAKALPAAAEALEAASDESSAEVVPLSSLSPRELAQNLGLPQRQAEASRQRDFDEPFFFAGASENDLARFREVAGQQKLTLRQHGVLWSLSVGGDVSKAVRELLKLYQKVFRFRPTAVAIAPGGESADLFPGCDRRILLTKDPHDHDGPPRTSDISKLRTREHSLSDPDAWEGILAEITSR